MRRNIYLKSKPKSAQQVEFPLYRDADVCTADEKFYIEDYFVAARADDDVDTDDDIIAGADRQVREDINQTEYLS